jgi:hypothetical protein
MANKLTTYILVLSGLMLLFYFTGLLDNTINSTLLNVLLEPETLRTSTLVTKVILIIEALIAAGLFIGTFLGGSPELAAKAPFTLYLFNLFFDIIYIFNVVKEANVVIAILLFSPLLLLYVLTIVEWFGGHD